MLQRLAIVPAMLAAFAAGAHGQPRVWIADQGDNQGFHNRILEIHPFNPGNFEDSDVQLIQLLTSPAGAFLDELTFDDQDRLWCVVKEEPDQDPDGARRIDKETGDIDDPPGFIQPDFPGESFGGFLEGLAWDGSGLWVTAVRDGLAGNMLTRVDPLTGGQIAPFDAGALGAKGLVDIPGNIAQGAVWEPGNGGYGWLWHSDWGISRICKLDISRLFDGDDGNDDDLVVAEYSVPFQPKGMDWMDDVIWVASPHNGIWEFDPATGSTQKLFNTPSWNLDGIAILDEPPGPKIVLSTHLIEREVWIFNQLAEDVFTVTNVGDGRLDYQITDDVGWLTAAPDAGSSVDQADPITVSYEVAELRAGVYPARITVTGNAYNSPQTIQVMVTVQTVWADFDGDCDVDQEDFGHLQRCFSGPGIPQQDPECFDTDFDKDNDADTEDFDRFQSCHSGADVCAASDCESQSP